MFEFFGKKYLAEVFCDYFEDQCIHLAINDLCSDLERISSRRPVIKKYLPKEEVGYIVIGSLLNERFRGFLREKNVDMSPINGKWENYVIKTFGDNNENLLICGSDERGTMWGVYEVCEKILGIDPLYFWTDNEPEKRVEFMIDSIDIAGAPKTYKFRGWFINDEDLFTEWKDGGGKRYIDYPFYHQVTHQDIIEKAIETALRLKQNLIIPASFIDIQNPAEENLVRITTERGMFISQHHVEPMGVSHFGWDNYWRKRGMDIPASFVVHPDKFEEIWTDYAEKWARYRNVIWQFGLRGRGDRPVWHHDSNVSPSMEDRGKLISSAIAKQKEIVEKVLGHKDFYSTATLWLEGSDLHNDGYLTFPEDTMVIFADDGPSQMLGDDFYNVKRQVSNKYGIYYHVAFWGDGPHLVQGTSLEKIVFNYRNAVEKGDTIYSVLNVTNIREVAFGLKAVADITWDFNSFDKDMYLTNWCSRQFGPFHAKETGKAYKRIYNCFYRLDDKRIQDHRVMLDGTVRHAGLKLIKFLKDADNKHELISENEVINFNKSAASKAIPMWEEAYDYAFNVLNLIDVSRRQYFIDNVIVQIEIAKGLYSWLLNLSLAAEAKVMDKDTAKSSEYIRKAVHSMEKLIMDRSKAEHGKWQGWYRGDKKMNLPGVLRETKELLK